MNHPSSTQETNVTQASIGRPLCTTLVVFLLLSVLGACKKESVAPIETAPPDGVAGVASKTGAFLAYAHTVKFEVAPDSIAGLISALQGACNDERFGACSVLAVESTSGRHATGSIAMRVVPAGVERLVELGANGAQAASRRTHAEDLADAVAAVTDSQDLLARQRAKLLEFSERNDLAVADLITLSERLAAVDAQLQSLAQDAAQQRRRIETNHLQIDFASNAEWEDESDFSFGELRKTFASNLEDGVEGAAEYAGFLLPLVILFFPLALLWRWLWRWVTRNSRTK